MTQQQLDELYKECEQAKSKGDHEAYVVARRAYLLAQAELYQQRKAAK